MRRERFLFLPSPLPCGSALWAPDLTGRKSWRYSPECVEEEFCELRYNGVLRCSHERRLDPLRILMQVKGIPNVLGLELSQRFLRNSGSRAMGGVAR
jgi:hypothetical protein